MIVTKAAENCSCCHPFFVCVSLFRSDFCHFGLVSDAVLLPFVCHTSAYVWRKQVEVCRSQHTQTWLGSLYIYKGLLLVVGVYMAWETRHVKIPALNDSQYIGVSVYSVVITSAATVVLANLISERVTLAFITITALILTSTTSTLCLLFLPKMQDIYGKGTCN